MITAELADTGHAVYSPAVLRTYDWLVATGYLLDIDIEGAMLRRGSPGTR